MFWMRVRYLRFVAAVILIVSGCATVSEARDYRDASNLAELISDQAVPYLLLDVRTPAEYASGHIPTAVNLPYDQISARVPKVAKDSLVIVYCASGRRAAIATKTLESLGFTNVTDFGAISSWNGTLVKASE